MAPEIVEERKYDNRADIWSLGVITHILLSGRPPFSGRTKDQIFKSIRNDEVLLNHPIWVKCSQSAKDFIKSMLAKDFKKRPSASELLEHPFIKKNVHEAEVANDV